MKQLDPQQSVAVYGLTNSLRLLQDFTTDPAVLRGAIQKSGTQAALQGVSEGDLIDHSMSDSMNDSVPDTVYQRTREFESESSAQQLDVRVQRTLDALESIARRLQGVPGRKNLIWLSGSFPLDLYPDNDYSSQSARHYEEQLLAVLTVLENARIAIYPVDANGLMTDPTMRADRNTPSFNRRGGIGMADDSQQWRNQNESSHDTMKLVAEKTGGRAFYNRNDLKNAVQTAIDDGSTYYSLSFTPGKEEGDGKQHLLKLTTARKGVDLRYRRGYIAMNSEAPSKQRVRFMQEELASALTDSQQNSTGIVFYATPAQDGKSIDLLIDANFLTFAHGENGLLQVQFQVATATFDKKGKVIKSSADVLGKELNPADAKRFIELGAHFKAPIEKTETTKRVRIAVRDLATDRIGTVDVKLD
jgi:VWFA-related protein